MMRSLYSGVAGLRTHQTKMDVLGNNIANVNTTSYKSQSITFSDLMYQTTQTASGASETKGGVNARQIGLGAKSGAISTAIESQGATQTTNNPFDIMITGSSFFIVNNGKENLYTRDGSFYVDGAGNLAMQSNGYFVQGWAAKEDKKTGEIQVDKNGDITSLQIMSADNATYSPASTTASLYSGNIDDHDTNVTSDDGKTITLEFYDNKGYLYTGKFTLKDTGTDHLFSLELTDIIDSDGRSINDRVQLSDGTKLIDHITFGEVQSKKNIEHDDHYYVKCDDTTAANPIGSIYQQAGGIAFDNVPATGTDFSKLSEITNFLQDVYGIDSKQAASYTASLIDYQIGTENLTINYNHSDLASTSIKNVTYNSFKKDNTDAYYYNDATKKGFLAPKTSDSPISVSELSTDMLKAVFPDTDAYPNIALAKKNYSYTFDGDSDTITITATKLPKVTEKKENASNLKSDYDDYFTNDDAAGPKISDFIANLPAGYTKAVYEYEDNGSLSIYGVKTIETDGVEADVVAESGNALFDLLSAYVKGDVDFTDISAAALTDLQNAATVASILPQSGNIANFTYSVSKDEGTGSDPDTYTVDFGQYSFSITSEDTGALLTFLSSLDYSGGATSFVSGDVPDDAVNPLLAKINAEEAKIDYYDVSYELSSNNDGYKITVKNGATTIGSFNAKASDYANLDNYIKQTASASGTGHKNYSDLTAAQQKALRNLVNDSDGVYDNATLDFTTYTLTGTPGIGIKVTYKTEVENNDDLIASYSKFEKDFPAGGSYVLRTPSAVARAKNDEAYCLFDEDENGFTLDEVPDEVLKALYGDDVTHASIMDTTSFPDKTESDYDVHFTNGGIISVTHAQEKTVSADRDKYNIEVKDGIATVTYQKDTIVYPRNSSDSGASTTFPLHGKIVDAIEAADADSPLKGMLKTVYGITDDDARAYGDSGMYTIDPESGKLTLSTGETDTDSKIGNKVIQLQFNAATGALDYANGKNNGMVKMVFDRTIEGLEAFGYQKGENETDETIDDGQLVFDFSTVTNYNTSGSSTIKAVKGDKKSLNTGRAVGEMNGVNISTDGRIYATYSNGQTKLLGQIASAQFANASGLSKEGDNLYSSTLNSGEATVQDITTDGGYMNTGVLEMSNVDLSREFTEMITTQRGFQANSRIITVSDTLLEELTNLKR